jgi:hypothetical protein
MIRTPPSKAKGKARSSTLPTGARTARATRSSICLLRSVPTGLRASWASWKADPPIADAQLLLPHLIMPAHHEVRASDVIVRRLHGSLAAAADRGPKDFPELLLTPSVGARTLRALAMVAEVVHGTPCRFADPARFSLAHGGKDRQPFPVPLKVYDETITVLKSAIAKAKLGQDEKLAALKRLDDQARQLERASRGPAIEQFIAEESRLSHSYGGRSVFGNELPPQAPHRTGSRAG